MPPAKVVHLNLRLPPELHERLGEWSRAEHRSLHGQVLHVLVEALEREDNRKAQHVWRRRHRTNRKPPRCRYQPGLGDLQGGPHGQCARATTSRQRSARCHLRSRVVEGASRGLQPGRPAPSLPRLLRSRGYTVVAEYADEGVSAHTDNLAKRPDFSRMLADAEAGRFDIIVVHKMDRFARKLRVALECLEQLGRAHVGVVSVSEPNLDYSTPQGFLFLSMLGALAEWYSRNLSTETKKGWAERKRRGLYAGRLPFGTVKGEDGVPVPDTAPIDVDGRADTNHEGLLLAFERAAEGATDAEVAEALERRRLSAVGPRAARPLHP